MKYSSVLNDMNLLLISFYFEFQVQEGEGQVVGEILELREGLVHYEKCLVHGSYCYCLQCLQR